MPEMDLKPEDYRVQTKRGRFINRDNWRLYFVYVGGGAAFWLGFAWWNRAELSTVLFGSLCLFAGLLVGVGLGGWLKRFD